MKWDVLGTREFEGTAKEDSLQEIEANVKELIKEMQSNIL